MPRQQVDQQRIEYFLQQLVNEILPDFGRASLKQDPVEFERKFEVLTQIWLSTQGDTSA